MNEICISNLSWNFEEKDAIRILNENGIKKIEISPVKSFGPWEQQQLKHIKKYGDTLRYQHGIEVVSLQSILYGKKYNIFTDQKQILEHLKNVFDICDELKCYNIIFGSPSSRKTLSFSKKECDEMFLSFCSTVQDILKGTKIILGIEANPKFYGCEYINTYSEYEKIFYDFEFKNIRYHFDLSCCLLEGEDYKYIFKNISKDNNFLHISTKNLLSLNANDEVKKFLTFAKEHNIIDKTFSIEMLNQDEEEVSNTIKFVKSFI